MPISSLNLALSSGYIQSGLLGNASVLSGNIGSGQLGGFHIASGFIQAGTNVQVVLDSDNNYIISAVTSGASSIYGLTVASGLSLNSGTVFDGTVSMVIGISSGGVVAGMLADNSVDGTKVASGSLNEFAFASGTVFPAVLSSGIVTSGFLGDGSVNTNNISSGAVSSEKLADEVITSGKIAAGSIGAVHLQSGLVIPAELSSGQVVSGYIGDNAVVSGSIGSGQVGYPHLASGFLFQNDLTISLNSGKTFGRYTSGQTIPSNGKSPLDVIMMAISEPVTPMVYLSGSPDSYNYGISSFANTLNYSAVIKSTGASTQSALLQFRRGGSGSWSTLYSGTLNSGSYLHSGTNVTSDASSFDYQYIFVDTQSMSGSANKSITIAQPTSPTVSLTRIPTTYSFGATAISTTVTYSAIVNTLGASGKIALLEYRRGGVGGWTALYSGLVYSGAYIHTDTNTFGNSNSYDYQFTFVDSANMSGRASTNVTFGAYSAPTINLYVSGTTISTPETNALREKGNYSSDLGGTITRNSPFVNLQTYQLQALISGSWTNVGTSVNISGQSSVAFGPTNHNDSVLAGASSVSYRVQVVDQNTTTNGSSNTVNFSNMIWYGASAIAPTTSSAVRALSDRMFTSGSNPFNLNTGSTYNNFTVAMQSGKTLVSVIDLDALNTDITSVYINNPFNVNDAGGTPTSYNVYTLTAGVPYTSNHRHQVTRTA